MRHVKHVEQGQHDVESQDINTNNIIIHRDDGEQCYSACGLWISASSRMTCCLSPVREVTEIECEVDLPGHGWVKWVYTVQVALLWNKD